MATTKKAAEATETKTIDTATETAEKKTTAKKPAAKKPAAKKTTAAAEKKPAAKKPAAKKTTAAASKKAESEPAAKKPAAKKAEAKTGIEVKLVRGLAGCKKDQIATAWSMGLKKVGDATIQPDNAATKGKIKKIVHLVKVTDAK